MSIPAFIDVGESDQTAELRGYLKSLGAEISEELSEVGVWQDVSHIIEASDVIWKNVPDSTEIEGIFNSILSLLLYVPPEKMDDLVITLCEKILKADNEGSGEMGELRLKLLTNLFHGLDEKNPLRYNVYISMVKLAGQTDIVEHVETNLNTLHQWMSMWQLSMDKQQHLLRLLHDALQETDKSEAATKIMVELLGTYTDDNASQARDDAHKCIVTSLRDPKCFLLDNLLALKPVKFLEGELIHDLLTVFVTGKFTQYMTFYETNTAFIKSLGLSHEDSMHKMRILTLMSMATEKKEMTFDTIEQELNLSSSEVEGFVIDAVRSKMLQATIDQMQKKVIACSATYRTFGRAQWQQLRDRLELWRLNLNQVRSSLESLGPAS
ncbi:eukaryotic translation initiation factor 3 subunit M-like isoform X2 [Ptychodera flava]|uniref:eukaryotic translation initiation factor 3 subunit M-like isoform X2 n=1 Tax=Ptychodera flava TaxID=63121 RepID=UPI00396A5DFF